VPNIEIKDELWMISHTSYTLLNINILGSQGHGEQSSSVGTTYLMYLVYNIRDKKLAVNNYNSFRWLSVE